MQSFYSCWQVLAGLMLFVAAQRKDGLPYMNSFMKCVTAKRKDRRMAKEETGNEGKHLGRKPTVSWSKQDETCVYSTTTQKKKTAETIFRAPHTWMKIAWWTHQHKKNHNTKKDKTPGKPTSSIDKACTPCHRSKYRAGGHISSRGMLSHATNAAFGKTVRLFTLHPSLRLITDPTRIYTTTKRKVPRFHLEVQDVLQRIGKEGGG